MRKAAIALLATALITSGAFAADKNYQQEPQGSQTWQQKQDRGQQNTQDQANPPNNQQAAKNNEPISPLDLSLGEVQQVQQALDKGGFKTGPTDGRWGPRSEDALKQFQQSRQIPANGELDRQTFADLGLDAATFAQPQK